MADAPSPPPSPALEKLLATPHNVDAPEYQARLDAAWAELTPTPSPPPVTRTVEEIAAGVRKTSERRQLLAALDAELQRVPYRSQEAVAILEEKAALIAAIAAEAAEPSA